MVQSVSLAEKESLRHQEFPGGPPSKYYPGPTMLNFRDRTRTGCIHRGMVVDTFYTI